jgi:hypothetical protein
MVENGAEAEKNNKDLFVYHKNANIGNNWKYPIYIYQMCDDSVS